MRARAPSSAPKRTCSGGEAGTKKGYSGVAVFVRGGDGSAAAGGGGTGGVRVVGHSTGLGDARADDVIATHEGRLLTLEVRRWR